MENNPLEMPQENHLYSWEVHIQEIENVDYNHTTGQVFCSSLVTDWIICSNQMHLSSSHSRQPALTELQIALDVILFTVALPMDISEVFNFFVI